MNKFSKRSFLKFAGGSGVFALFQALFRAPQAEAQTWQRLQVGPPKLKVRTPQRNQKVIRSVIAAGSNHIVALRADGTIFATGGNYSGQLGDNTATNKNTFVSAKGVSNVVAIAAGFGFSAALRADGAVFATGGNHMGQLGDNTTAGKSTFVSSI